MTNFEVLTAQDIAKHELQHMKLWTAGFSNDSYWTKQTSDGTRISSMNPKTNEHSIGLREETHHVSHKSRISLDV